MIWNLLEDKIEWSKDNIKAKPAIKAKESQTWQKFAGGSILRIFFSVNETGELNSKQAQEDQKVP